MDTDSNHMASSADRLENIITRELREEFEACKKLWLAWDKWGGRTPALFRLECVGWRMFATCSKCYFIEVLEDEKRSSARKGW